MKKKGGEDGDGNEEKKKEKEKGSCEEKEKRKERKKRKEKCWERKMNGHKSSSKNKERITKIMELPIYP